MTRPEKPARRRAGNNAADRLDEALRQIGADMLDEPVPERLRQILRQAQGLHEALRRGEESDPAIRLRSQGPDRG
jgi:hypothetical protein